jgi:hypothetical protein
MWLPCVFGGSILIKDICIFFLSPKYFLLVSTVKAPIDFLKPSLEKFLHLHLQLLLFKVFDPRLLDAASAALFPLICACRPAYLAAVNQIISQQPDDIQQRLLTAFQKLDAVIPSQLAESAISRYNSIFCEALLVLLQDVRGVIKTK